MTDCAGCERPAQSGRKDEQTGGVADADYIWSGSGCDDSP